MLWTYWIAIGCFFAGSSVVMGAFAAHALKSKLSTEYLQIFETAARYQMTHALALILLGLVATRVENVWLASAGICIVLGVLLFSGSLYGLTLTENRILGLITPIGGMFMILGWLLFIVSVLRT